jgi:hypothetical protein
MGYIIPKTDPLLSLCLFAQYTNINVHLFGDNKHICFDLIVRGVLYNQTGDVLYMLRPRQKCSEQRCQVLM